MPQRVELAARRRLAVQPRLRQHPVDDDDRPVGKREPVRPEERRERAGRGEAASASATRSRTSFHAATASSAVSRTPRSQASPSRGCGVRGRPQGRRSPAVPRALTSRRRGQPEVVDSNRAGEQRPQVGRAEEVVLLRPGLPREVVRARPAARAASGRAAGAYAPRPGTSGSASSRTPAARRGGLADERLLALARAHVLDDGVRGATSNDASPNGSAHASPCTYGMCGYRSRKRAPSCTPSAVIARATGSPPRGGCASCSRPRRPRRRARPRPRRRRAPMSTHPAASDRGRARACACAGGRDRRRAARSVAQRTAAVRAGVDG